MGSGTGFLLYQPDKLERELEGKSRGGDSTDTRSLLSLEGCGRAGAGTGAVATTGPGTGAPGCATAQLAALPRWSGPHAHRRRVAGFILAAGVRRPGLSPATLATQGWVLVVQVALGHVALAGWVTGSVLERVGGVPLLVPIHCLPVLVAVLLGELVQLALQLFDAPPLGLQQLLLALDDVVQLQQVLHRPVGALGSWAARGPRPRLHPGGPGAGEGAREPGPRSLTAPPSPGPSRGRGPAGREGAHRARGPGGPGGPGRQRWGRRHGEQELRLPLPLPPPPPLPRLQRTRPTALRPLRSHCAARPRGTAPAAGPPRSPPAAASRTRRRTRPEDPGPGRRQPHHRLREISPLH
ncbi:hypothetical protein MC885_004906, partial [Smutsia gigantea]